MTLTTDSLRCQSLVDPIGLDCEAPLFSWICRSSDRAAIQTAYQLQVARADTGFEGAFLWDSGRVESNSSHHIEYAGDKLQSFLDLHWRVRVWDRGGNASAFSAPARFAMGFLSDASWQGSFIRYPIGSVHDVPMFRKSFRIEKPPARAWLAVTAKGLVDAYLDGERVSDDYFNPGWTDYLTRIHYRVYDVSKRLRSGDHMLGALLAEGWYKGQVGDKAAGIYGRHTALLVNLRLEYADRTHEVIASDASWQTRLSEYSQASIMHGEYVDARKRVPDWCKPGASPAGWQRPSTHPMDAPEWSDAQQKKPERAPILSAHPGFPVRVLKQLPAVAVHPAEPGSYIYDFGQNIAGVVRLRLKAPAGTVVRLRHGEMVNPDATLYVENLRSAKCTDTYVCAGGDEVYEPRFTFHGFRYVEVTGLGEPLPLSAVTALAVGSDTPEAGEFHCSSPMLNRLVSNIRWTQRANFLEVPTDCPQRDERLGWTGDAQVFIRTAIGMADVEAFFRKWLIDMADCQTEAGTIDNVIPPVGSGRGADAAWGDALTVCPSALYRCYGDRTQLEAWLPRMQKWVSHLEKAVGEDGIRQGPHCYGDWLALDGDQSHPWSGGGTPKPLIQTAYHAFSTKLVAAAARELGESAIAEAHEAKFKEIAAAFTHAFVQADGRVATDTQTGYVLALWFELLPEELRPKAFERLVANIEAHGKHLTTGFVGVGYLLPTLARFGRMDLAYTLLENETYPSWGYSIANGATTIWERWNGWKKGEGVSDANMNSYSHYAYGSVGEFLFTTVAGLEQLEPGLRTVRIAPRPGGTLENARYAYHCIAGRYVAGWERRGDAFCYEIEVPANCRAHCELPLGSASKLVEKGVALERITGVAEARIIDENAVFELGSGSYRFDPA